MVSKTWGWCICLMSVMTGSACATTPTSTAGAEEVSGQHVLKPTILIRGPGSGEVVVKRDSGLNTSTCRSRVFVNGEPVADIAPGEKATIYLPIGAQLLAAKPNGICAGELVEAQATVSEEKTATFRVSYGTWGDFTLQPTAF